MRAAAAVPQGWATERASRRGQAGRGLKQEGDGDKEQRAGSGVSLPQEAEEWGADGSIGQAEGLDLILGHWGAMAGLELERVTAHPALGKAPPPRPGCCEEGGSWGRCWERPGHAGEEVATPRSSLGPDPPQRGSSSAGRHRSSRSLGDTSE